jgi:DNA invertase Pin-like site-specific DNA recombinase
VIAPSPTAAVSRPPFRLTRLTLPPADLHAAAIYVRISEDREGAGLGVERQLQDGRRLCEQRGYRVVKVYTDNDLSAYLRKRPRKDYLSMMADLRDGRFGLVVVWHLDRLYRQPRELEDMIALCENGERRVESCYGDYDLSTPDGCFMARIEVANANKASGDMSRRIRRKMQELAEQGKPFGGRRAYGFTKDGLNLVPEEAAVIRECATRVLAGESLRSVAADCVRRGIRGTDGAEFRPKTIRRFLVAARISGQREHHGVIVGPAVWPAIITPEETERLRAIFHDPARRRPGRGVSYLLSGFVRCGKCGAPMRGRPRNGHRRYVCIHNLNDRPVGCGGISRNAEPIDQLVTEALFAIFDSPAMARALAAEQEDQGPVLMEQIAADQAQLAELAGAYAAKQITMPEWLAARGPIERRIEERSAEFATVSRKETVNREYVGRGGALREDWGLLFLDQQRAIIASVLDHIVVEPAARGSHRFDPDKIKPVWKV